MSELYRHLLIPDNAEFVPELARISDFIGRLDAMDALPKGATYVVLTNSGKTRRIAESSTGEILYGPDLKIDRCHDVQSAIDLMTGNEISDLCVQGKGPTAIPPLRIVWSESSRS